TGGVGCGFTAVPHRAPRAALLPYRAVGTRTPGRGAPCTDVSASVQARTLGIVAACLQERCPSGTMSMRSVRRRLTEPLARSVEARDVRLRRAFDISGEPVRERARAKGWPCKFAPGMST